MFSSRMFRWCHVNIPVCNNILLCALEALKLRVNSFLFRVDQFRQNRRRLALLSLELPLLLTPQPSSREAFRDKWPRASCYHSMHYSWKLQRFAPFELETPIQLFLNLPKLYWYRSRGKARFKTICTGQATAQRNPRYHERKID